MEKLIQLIVNIKKNREVRETINFRIQEFQKTTEKSTNEILKELCFCILTANFNAEKSIKIQEEINDGLLTFSESKLAKELKKSGHRFPNIRAKYIVEARMHEESINRIILSPGDEQEQRDWLAKNIKGIGYKEASHFLRNIGFTDLAIIDFHIIDLLTRLELIQKPKNLGKKKYLEIEKLLRNASIKLNMNLAELDLYMWYAETGKILK
ncbi:MAG: N-glycosylase/DNA lyase [Candidatus Methanomarinus sp.]|uniref:N-glycosylase/DNA lyase n=1 Tax=Candidatus Methanomarinus sp. TaxID=3386244 RepID=A0AC61SB38_9EURY|nr:N-glycosylase/DNA lyase [ANME-2 cluster archaeon]TKY91874.1 MAG: N-glycosylase/DNA lyase [ANME-2 cluster archaeon]